MKRMFTKAGAKGLFGYLDSQKKYEIARTVLYFLLSLAIFIMGYISTKTRANLLTVVAILGCLPACKSAVEMIMYCRYKSLDKESADKINSSIGNLSGLFDMVFTSYEKNFQVDHMVVRDNCICGYTSYEKLEDALLEKHLTQMLSQDGIKGMTIKVFHDLGKYQERLLSLNQLEEEHLERTQTVISVLKSISL